MSAPYLLSPPIPPLPKDRFLGFLYLEISVMVKCTYLTWLDASSNARLGVSIKVHFFFLGVQFSSVTQSCPTL